jgi:hypothetical protein
VINLTHGRWFSQGTPASSTTKTGRHDIAEILLKVALNTMNHKTMKPSTAGMRKEDYPNDGAIGSEKY